MFVVTKHQVNGDISNQNEYRIYVIGRFKQVMWVRYRAIKRILQNPSVAASQFILPFKIQSTSCFVWCYYNSNVRKLFICLFTYLFIYLLTNLFIHLFKPFYFIMFYFISFIYIFVLLSVTELAGITLAHTMWDWFVSSWKLNGLQSH